MNVNILNVVAHLYHLLSKRSLNEETLIEAILLMVTLWCHALNAVLWSVKLAGTVALSTT